MKNITVLNFKGESFSGEWNEKTYSSQIPGNEDLYRIYVSNEAIHITRQELEKITSDINKNDEEVADRILKMALNFSEEQKKQLFIKMVTSDEFLANQYTRCLKIPDLEKIHVQQLAKSLTTLTLIMTQNFYKNE